MVTLTMVPKESFNLFISTFNYTFLTHYLYFHSTLTSPILLPFLILRPWAISASMNNVLGPQKPFSCTASKRVFGQNFV